MDKTVSMEGGAGTEDCGTMGDMDRWERKKKRVGRYGFMNEWTKKGKEKKGRE